MNNVYKESYWFISKVHLEPILKLFYPEFITLVLQSFLLIFDCYLISGLKCTSSYATLGFANIFFHLITKTAEGLSIGIVVMCGQSNGIGEFKKVGYTIKDAFWVTCIFGAIISLIIFFGARLIYKFYGVPEEILTLGIPFLKLRSVGVFLSFIYFALIGFLRGIKNTKAPMYFFLAGALSFIFFDYALILGKFGFASKEFQGSAYASIAQHAVMLVLALLYIAKSNNTQKYMVDILGPINKSNIVNLISLSWPIVLDKASFAIYYMWLAKMIALVAKASDFYSENIVLSSFVAIKDVIALAILPGLALAHVATILISNKLKTEAWEDIKKIIINIIFISLSMVSALLLIFSLWPNFFIAFFDKQEAFTKLASKILPLVSIFVCFDLLQIILSAALRGIACVKTVMITRISMLLFFVPFSYAISLINLESIITKFVLVYSSFYMSSLIMSFIYVKYLKSTKLYN